MVVRGQWLSEIPISLESDVQVKPGNELLFEMCPLSQFALGYSTKPALTIPLSEICSLRSINQLTVYPVGLGLVFLLAGCRQLL